MEVSIKESDLQILRRCCVVAERLLDGKPDEALALIDKLPDIRRDIKRAKRAIDEAE